MRDDLMFALLVVFVPFSLVSIGGGTSVIAGIQHQVVELRHWMSAREFVDAFAIARAAPGPGTMLATLIGWHIGGWSGAVIATLAFFLPSTLLCYGVVHVWSRHRGKPWHTALEQGLAPVGGGLILAGALSVLRLGGGGIVAWAVALASAGVLALRPKIHPFILFIAGAAIFVAAHIANG
jgi:chromate transporter